MYYFCAVINLNKMKNNLLAATLLLTTIIFAQEKELTQAQKTVLKVKMRQRSLLKCCCNTNATKSRKTT
jgi:hypothetical protein